MMDKPFGEVDSSIYIHIFQRFMYLVEKGEWVGHAMWQNSL